MVVIATEMLGLLQTALALASKKAELDKQYFEQFIQPTWEAFRKVHEDYKASFKVYIDSIASDDHDVKKLIQKIRNDSIQTEDIRMELAQMVNNLHSDALKTKSSYLTNFAEAIRDYFNIHEQFVSINYNGEDVLMYKGNYPVHDISNIPRFEAIIYLSRQGDVVRKESKEFLEKTLMNVQRRYDRVSGAYHQLRKSLLI